MEAAALGLLGEDECSGKPAEESQVTNVVV
jgi:hypothetical protein